MLFKQIFQARIGMQLQDTLNEELTLIEKRAHNGHEQEEWRGCAVDAHHARNDAKAALDAAKNEQTDVSTAWLLAYHKAADADKAIAALLQCKVENYFHFEMTYNKIVLLVFVPVASSKLFSYASLETVEQVERLCACLIFIMILPLIIKTGMMERYNFDIKALGADLLTLEGALRVVDEAHQLGINIDINKPRPPQSQPWSNAQLLADIACEAIPNKYCCEITSEPMTNPVYCNQKEQDAEKARYDLSSISTWLKQQNTHPATCLSLFEENLIPATSLQAEIGLFAHEETKKYIQDNVMYSMLTCIEDGHSNEQKPTCA